jgi:hypothetical protein
MLKKDRMIRLRKINFLDFFIYFSKRVILIAIVGFF